MKYKKVGKMTLEMSALGYGCWGASGQPSWGGHTDQDQIKAIQAAIDGGINFFDVAPVYGLGHAEEVLGQAIKGKRNDIYIATKCGLPWKENKQVRNDVRPEAILKEIDESLIRLGVDHVDLYQVHWPTADGVAIEDTAKALANILETGKARYVGLSNYSVEDAKTFNKYVEIASMQGLYNMIEQNAESYHGIGLDYRVKDEVLPYVDEAEMAFLPYSPLFQGLLSGDFNEDTTFIQGDVRLSNPKLNGLAYQKHFKLVKELATLSKDFGYHLNEVALNWLIHQKSVSSVIAGAKNAHQVARNLKALEWEMTSEMYNQINNLIKKANL